MGDVFFSLVNLSRFLHVDPDNALALTNKKFMDRFFKMEELAVRSGKQLHDMNLAEMDALWQEVKKQGFN